MDLASVLITRICLRKKSQAWFKPGSSYLGEENYQMAETILKQVLVPASQTW
jgi:hypothetical protein